MASTRRLRARLLLRVETPQAVEFVVGYYEGEELIGSETYKFLRPGWLDEVPEDRREIAKRMFADFKVAEDPDAELDKIVKKRLAELAGAGARTGRRAEREWVL